jgi:hypothetical protein
MLLHVRHAVTLLYIHVQTYVVAYAVFLNIFSKIFDFCLWILTSHFFCGEGRTAALRLIVNPVMEMISFLLFSK